MSFDPNNPTQIIKDGLIFAAISQVVAFATKRAAEFASELPDNEEEYFEDDYLGKTMMVKEYHDNPQDLGHFLPKANSQLLREYRDSETSEDDYAARQES